jgi:hypothetical protein
MSNLALTRRTPCYRDAKEMIAIFLYLIGVPTGIAFAIRYFHPKLGFAWAFLIGVVLFWALTGLSDLYVAFHATHKPTGR